MPRGKGKLRRLLTFLSAVQSSDRKIKFIFSKKATKIDKIFTIDLTFTT